MKVLFKLSAILAVVGVSYLLISKLLFSSDEQSSSGIKEVSGISESENFNSDISIDDDPFSLLILGIDDEEIGQGSRSDSIVLAVVNPKESKVTLTSIYRDLLVDIPGYGEDKINAAYSYGGVDLTAETIENKFDIPIENYAIINFDGFKELVDAIGGLEVNVEKDMMHFKPPKQNEIMLEQGLQQLNGEDTLNYVRYRSDGEGDFGRTRRQRQVIGDIVEQTADLRNVSKIFDIYDALNDNFDSNIKRSDLAKVGLKMRNIESEDLNIESFEGDSTSYNGVSYVESPEEEIERISSILKNELND